MARRQGPALREAAAAARSLEAAGWEARLALAVPDLPRNSKRPAARLAKARCFRTEPVLADARPRASLASASAVHECGREADVLGDHRVSCPRSGLLACRALAVEQAWARVAREDVGPEGPPGVSPDDRRRLDLVVHGATERGEALSAVMATRRRGAVPRAGPASPAAAAAFVRQLARVRARRAPPAVQRVARAGWSWRWLGILAVAVQRAVCSTVLGRWMSPPLPAGGEGPLLGDILCLAEPCPQQPPPPRVMVPFKALA